MPPARHGKESAYRLRKRPGAAGFAAAWDAALGKSRSAVDLVSAKSTGLDASYRLQVGLLQVVMDRGRYAGSVWKDDDNALLQQLGHVDRAGVGEGESHGAYDPRTASTQGVDFIPADAGVRSPHVARGPGTAG